MMTTVRIRVKHSSQGLWALWPCPVRKHLTSCFSKITHLHISEANGRLYMRQIFLNVQIKQKVLKTDVWHKKEKWLSDTIQNIERTLGSNLQKSPRSWHFWGPCSSLAFLSILIIKTCSFLICPSSHSSPTQGNSILSFCNQPTDTSLFLWIQTHPSAFPHDPIHCASPSLLPRHSQRASRRPQNREDLVYPASQPLCPHNDSRIAQATKTEENWPQNKPVAIPRSELSQPAPPLHLSLCRARYYLCSASTLF